MAQNIEKIVLSDNNKLNIQDERVNRLVNREGAVALGNASTAGGNGSFAAGTVSTSPDTNGERTQALGYGSVALGCGSKAYAYGSVAVGNMCEAGDKSTNDYTAYNAIAGGAYCEAKGVNSIALGSKTIASGLGSFAGGNSTKASGEGSFAFGTSSNTKEYDGYQDENATQYPEARQKGSIALGCGTKAYSYGSIAIGDLCEAGILSNNGGYNAFAGGSKSLAEGINSFAFGAEAKAYSAASIAMGYKTRAVGVQSVALGSNTKAAGAYSLAGGYNAWAIGDYSFSFGNTTDANGKCSVALGHRSGGVGDYSFAGGESAQAHGKGSLAFGTSTTTKTENFDEFMRYPTYVFEGEERIHPFPVAKGAGSVALGCATEAFSYGSVAFGNMCKAGELVKDGEYVGYNAIAGGAYTHAKGANSVALGSKTVAEGACSFAGGQQTKALGLGSFAFGALSTLPELEGVQTEAGNKEDRGSIALGIAVQAFGSGAMAIGCGTKAATHYSFAGGKMAQATGLGSFAFGISSDTDEYIYQDKKATKYPEARRKGSVALGCGTKAYSYGSIAIGDLCEAGVENGKNGANAFSGGYQSQAKGSNSFAFGSNAKAQGGASVSIGYQTDAWNAYSIALGHYTKAKGNYSFAFGTYSTAEGSGSFAGGVHAHAKGPGSFAFGTSSDTNGYKYQGDPNATKYPEARQKGSIALGCGTKAYSYSSVAIGDLCEAGVKDNNGGYNTFAGGARSLAKGSNSFAFGSNVKANGGASISMGYHTEARYAYSVALGNKLIANQPNQCVVGKYNTITASSNSTTDLFIVGNGSADKRSNAFRVNSKGTIHSAAGTFIGADYAEYFEWQDGNPEAEDRIGYVVTLDADKIRLAQEGEEILGIISGTAGVVGDSGTMDWQGRFVKDAFGRIIYDEVEEFEEYIDPETQETIRVSLGMAKHPRTSPDYDPEQEYISREERPEWACVGMFGKLYVHDDGTCIPNAYARCVNGVLTYSSERTNIKVMKRTDSNIVYVFLK